MTEEVRLNVGNTYSAKVWTDREPQGSLEVKLFRVLHPKLNENTVSGQWVGWGSNNKISYDKDPTHLERRYLKERFKRISRNRKV